MHATLPAWPEIAWSHPAGDGAGPRVLGLSPWIHDFAAYNVWLRPLGLLSCLSMLRHSGASVALLDCLHRTWQDVPWPDPASDGSGRFPKTALEAPPALAYIPRTYSRYGLSRSAAAQALKQLHPPPDLILITCLMTYWYPGAWNMIELAREIWPKTPVALGGVYATLCHEHALGAGADLVVSGRLEEPDNWAALWKLLGEDPPPLSALAAISPALDLYNAPDFSVIIGSRGCPFSCPYCASRTLNGSFAQRPFQAVWDDLEPELSRGVEHFVFYDDALLITPRTWLLPLLARLAADPGRAALHAPNAMHLAGLDQKICGLLRQAGLRTVRLGLETTDFNERLDSKATLEDWFLGVGSLLDAGFRPKDIGVYILFGLPGQDPAEVEASISEVRSMGLRPHLTQYSPIPGSELFPDACAASPHPLAQEPLFQNNSLWPCVDGGFTWKQAKRWKSLVNGLNPA